jgi:tetratricopeptide (TPR) repeat protein
MEKKSLSYVASHRMIFHEGIFDEVFRRQSAGWPRRLDADGLGDDELVARLRTFGITIDRPALDRLSDRYLSAGEIADAFLENYSFETEQEENESEWIWICLDALWRRWFPDKPSFEALDDKIQEGYEILLFSGERIAACDVWLKAWDIVTRILDKVCIDSAEHFDELFLGTNSLSEWVEDLDNELSVAGRQNPRFYASSIAIGEDWPSRFPASDSLAELWRTGIAHSYFELGDAAKTDALYGEWLNSNPRWGEGWGASADCYIESGRPENLEKAERLLRQALSINGVGYRLDLADRLAEICEQTGRASEARKLRVDNVNGDEE